MFEAIYVYLSFTTLKRLYAWYENSRIYNNKKLIYRKKYYIKKMKIQGIQIKLTFTDIILNSLKIYSVIVSDYLRIIV